MRNTRILKRLLLGAAMATAVSCGKQPQPERGAAVAEAKLDIPEPSGPPLVQQARREAPEWRLDGQALRLAASERGREMVLACTGRPLQLVVDVPGFTPIGSEDRFVLGLDDQPITLVADLTSRQGVDGVTAEGPVPADFGASLVAARTVSALYGTQRIGPVPAPSPDAAEAFLEACS